MNVQEDYDELQVSTVYSDEDLVNKRLEPHYSPLKGAGSFFYKQNLHKNIHKSDYTIWRRFCSNLYRFESFFNVGPRSKTEMKVEPLDLHRTNTN